MRSAAPRPPHLRIRPPALRRRWAELARRRPVFVFTARLCVALAATFALICAGGYVAIGDQLQRRLISSYAQEHRADAHSLERAAAGAPSSTEANREIGELLRAIARRPGTLEALLIDRRHVVEVAGEASLEGEKDADARIDGALFAGRSYAGHEADPELDGRDFEFVVPVELPDGRHAFEVTRDHTVLDSQLAAVRRTLVLLALVAFVAGACVFYLVGGRALVRSHRIAVRRASRDGLTDLPNQRAFSEDIAREVASAERHGDPLCVVTLDLDDFKFLNDRHGHPHGDALLRRAAAILDDLRAGDLAYRLGGDEFAVLLPRTDADGARTAGRRLHRALGDAGIAASIGLSALRPGHEPEALLAEADAALYEAKRHGGSGVFHFDDIRDRVAVTRPAEVRAVHQLLDEGELTTAFQPIWNLATGELLGVEALTRPDARYGLASPAQAFDVAEQIGRVRDLDALCVRSALGAARDLPGGALLFLNIAPQTLDLDAGDTWILRAVQEAGLDPGRVVIEVTERFSGRTASVLRCLRRLRAQGFKLALDDVGSGNSGLEMLREVGAEFVKLDRSIVAAAPEEANARAVLLAMATFARQTGAFVIAEGIEDAALLEYVRTIDDRLLHNGTTIIQGGQGYGLGRPSPQLPALGACLEPAAPLAT
jgi:diguanylate cyclase (GGDEF)-like protein